MTMEKFATQAVLQVSMNDDVGFAIRATDHITGATPDVVELFGRGALKRIPKREE